MRQTSVCLFAIAIASASVAGCGGGDTVTDAGTDGAVQPTDGGPHDAFVLPDASHDGGHDAGTDAPACTGTDLCTTAGTTCTGNTLMTCAAATDGCLRTTSSDCSTSHTVCDATGGTASCVDPCAHIPVADRCTAASRTCNANSLDVCAMDTAGCFSLTHTDCSTSAGGSCDATAAMAVCISTADPCGGLTSCGTAETRTCMDTTHVAICSGNAAGCYLPTTTTCGAHQVCSVAGGAPAMCVSACSLVTTCPSANYCAGNDAVVCGFDTNTCLVERSRTTCANTCNGGACVAFTCGNGALDTGETCDDGNRVAGDGCSALCVTESGYNCSGTPSVCVATAANATCSMATVVSATRTINGEDTHVGGTSPNGPGCTTAAGATLFYSVSIPAFTGVQVDVTPDAVIDPVIRVQDSCAAAGCTSRTDLGNGGDPETFTVNNTTASAITRIVEVDGYSASSPGVYSVTFTYIAANCGNGTTGAGEACDDGNTTSGDGCSSTCTIEPGYSCTTASPAVCTYTCGDGTLDTGEGCDDNNMVSGDGCSSLCQIEAGYSCGGTPSVCVMTAANSTCAGARAVTGTTTYATENTLAGGASPTGTSVCGSAGGPTLYYHLAIPAHTGVNVVATPTGFDLVLKTESTCTAADCASRTDVGFTGDAETYMITNTTGAATTQIVAVNAYSGSGGPVSVAFTYFSIACGDGVVATGEACDDGNLVAGDGCSATCTVEASYGCSGSPSVCVHLPTYTTITAACVDVSASTPLAIMGSDDAVSPVTALPFAFTFFGVPQMSYSVSSNGNVQLFSTATGTASTEYFNVGIPDTSAPNGYIAPFWDDILHGVQRVAVTGTTGSRRMIIEWGGDRGGDAVRFQAMLYEGTNIIEYHYCAMAATANGSGASATVGVENANGTFGTQIAYDTAGSTTTGTGYRLMP